ncbi:MAG: hypothetical protein AAF633_28160 [Chloroflexota bacterium]
MKEKGIVYQREESEDGYYLYQILGRQLTFAIYPYNPELGSIGRSNRPKHELEGYVHTRVTLSDINGKNHQFAEELAVAIDEMIKTP